MDKETKGTAHITEDGTAAVDSFPAKRKPARLTALLLFLAGRERPASTDEIRAAVGGYDLIENEESFKRMFRRDRETLARCGIELQESAAADPLGAGGSVRYSIDPKSTLAADIPLTPRQAAYLRTISLRALSSPTFPRAVDLRRALNKLSDALGIVIGQDDHPVTRMERDLVDTFLQVQDACDSCRRIDFLYCNRTGACSQRTVCPHALFLFQGEWYLFASDEADGERKNFRISQMDAVAPSTPRCKHAEFEQLDLSLDELIKFPFQCGREAPFTACFAFSPTAMWRITACTVGKGRVTPLDGGGALWEIEANDRAAAGRWALEHAPGVTLVAPDDAVDRMRAGLRALCGGDGHGAA